MEIERKPWFVGDEEKQGLTTVPTTPNNLKGVKSFGKDLQEEISSAVPQLQSVALDKVICEYGEKDGLYNFHFYLPVRYAIRMEAEEQMERARRECSKEQLPIMQQRIADHGNQKLAENPWPGNMEALITESFKQVFPYSEFKVSFFPEVDSWSVVMPEPKRGFITERRMTEPAHQLNQRLSAG